MWLTFRLTGVLVKFKCLGRSRYFMNQQRLILSLFAFIVVISLVPLARAQVSLSLTATSCDLYPLAGTSSCTVTNNQANSINEAPGICLSWTSNNHLSVSVTGTRIGAPTLFPISNGQCFDTTDLTFDFTVTYVGSCANGSYSFTFTASTPSGSSSSQTFTAVVRCAFTP